MSSPSSLRRLSGVLLAIGGALLLLELAISFAGIDLGGWLSVLGYLSLAVGLVLLAVTVTSNVVAVIALIVAAVGWLLAALGYLGVLSELVLYAWLAGAVGMIVGGIALLVGKNLSSVAGVLLLVTGVAFALPYLVFYLPFDATAAYYVLVFAFPVGLIATGLVLARPARAS